MSTAGLGLAADEWGNVYECPVRNSMVGPGVSAAGCARV